MLSSRAVLDSFRVFGAFANSRKNLAGSPFAVPPRPISLNLPDSHNLLIDLNGKGSPKHTSGKMVEGRKNTGSITRRQFGVRWNC